MPQENDPSRIISDFECFIGKMRMIIPAKDKPLGYILVNRRMGHPTYVNENLEMLSYPGHDRLFMKAKLPVFATHEGALAWKRMHHRSAYGLSISNERALRNFEPHPVGMFLDPEHYHVVHATPNSDRALVECMYLNSGEESVGDMPPRQLFFVNTKSGEVVGRRIDGRQNVSAVSVWNEIAPQWAIEGVSAPDVRRQPPFDSLTECIDWLKNRHRLLGLSDQEDADAVIEDNGSLALGH